MVEDRVKIRLTNQIRNLIKNADSTNVKLGLVTGNINNTCISEVKNSKSTFSQAPSAIITPLGTIYMEIKRQMTQRD
jgi:hypothetical protein